MVASPECSQLQSLRDTPPDASAHAFVQLHLRLVAQFAAGDGDVAGDGVVHLTELVDLLLIASKTMNETVTKLGDTPCDRRQRP